MFSVLLPIFFIEWPLEKSKKYLDASESFEETGTFFLILFYEVVFSIAAAFPLRYLSYLILHYVHSSNNKLNFLLKYLA